MTGSRRRTITESAQAWVYDHEPRSRTEELVRHALSDFLAGRYFGWAEHLKRIHAARRSMYGDTRSVTEAAEVEDQDFEIVDLIARTATNPEKGRLEFHLARSLAPGTVLELGTSIGISAAYFALGLKSDGGGRVVTLDRSIARTTIARRIWSDIGVDNIDQVLGPFDEVLPPTIAKIEDLRLAYIDGNHQKDPTLRYQRAVTKHMSSGVIMFDDIRWSEGMEAAWAEIEAIHDSTVDLGPVGLVVLDS